MSDYSSNFPQQRPTLNLDFANSGKLDSRLSYSRSSTGTYLSNEKALNSENLIPYSNDLSQSVWTKRNLTVPATNITAPDGTSSASSLLETATSSTHDFYEEFSAVSGTSYTFTLYAKANGRDTLHVSPQATSTIASVVFDLTAVTSTVISGSADSHSITAIGSTGWYKLQVTVTATASGTGFLQTYFKVGGSTSYAGDATKGAYIWGCQVSSTGETILNETSGSIHRSYSPLLKTAAANEPRFEYAADGQSDAGSPLGLLIEAQAVNLQRYGSEFASWSGQNRVTTTSNVAIAPNGLLEADLITANTSATQTHNVSDNPSVIVSGTVYTGSVYVKDFGQRYVQMVGGSSSFGSSQWATFDLQTGSVDANGVTASAVSVGNGWYRIQVTMTSTAAGAGVMVIGLANSATATRLPLFAGNDYDGLLIWGFQLETGSSASSLVDTGTGSSQLSRAADSCSLVSAPLLDNGSGGLVVEYDMQDASNTSYVLHGERSTGGTNGGGFSLTNSYLIIENNFQNVGTTTSNVFHTVAASWESASQKFSRDGGAVAQNTSTVVPSGVDTLHVGTRQDGGESLNGHIRNISIYSEPLTSTNLTTLSQL